jgi:EAL domain-containing protein (putative c-di-GMP-specific phosphodiesterase class I)
MQQGSMSPAAAVEGEDGERSGTGSWARLAEDRVRAGSAGSVDWQGLRVSSHFQPLYCTRRARSVGYEALARCVDPRHGALPPARLFEATPPEGRVLLDWTLRALHLRNFAVVDPGDRMLFLNIHPEAAVNDARDGRELAGLIRYYGLVPRRVCVEILEAGCADERLLREAVARYRELGVSVALDDFGTARANLDRVVALRPDIVKIDLALFPDAVVGEARSRRMLAAAVAMLHEAHARVAIGGVETLAHARAAIGAKADYVQGVHFCAPQAALPDDAHGQQRLETLCARGTPRLAAI